MARCLMLAQEQFNRSRIAEADKSSTRRIGWSALTHFFDGIRARNMNSIAEMVKGRSKSKKIQRKRLNGNGSATGIYWSASHRAPVSVSDSPMHVRELSGTEHVTMMHCRAKRSQFTAGKQSAWTPFATPSARV